MLENFFSEIFLGQEEVKKQLLFPIEGNDHEENLYIGNVESGVMYLDSEILPLKSTELLILNLNIFGNYI